MDLIKYGKQCCLQFSSFLLKIEQTANLEANTDQIYTEKYGKYFNIVIVVLSERWDQLGQSA